MYTIPDSLVVLGKIHLHFSDSYEYLQNNITKLHSHITKDHMETELKPVQNAVDSSPCLILTPPIFATNA